MATVAAEPKTSTLRANVFDGSRQPTYPAKKVLFTIKDGNQNRIY
jgi:hypothetical protein